MEAMRCKYAFDMTREGVVKRVLKATKPRPDGGSDYEAVFGDVSLKTDPFAPIRDEPLQRHHIRIRCELVARLLANRARNLRIDAPRANVHHVRELGAPEIAGRRTPPIWKSSSASWRRKTLVVCHHCHVASIANAETNRLKADR